MASSFIKATAPKTTNKPSRSTARANCTDARLAASKSISPKTLAAPATCKAHELGLAAEARVVQYFLQKSFRIIKQRWRTPFAEIDLLVESPNGEVWIVEIKTLTSFDFLEARVGWKQKERLKRAFLYVQGKTQKPVCLYMAFVDTHGEILLLDDF
jgi:Holliday junction resolvase-like predicted endonuclease